MNINSPEFHFGELETCLANCPIDFQVLGITESEAIHPLQILYYQDLLMNICLQNQPMEALCFTLKMV